MADRNTEIDHNAARLLLRIEHAIYAGAEGVDREERAAIMADVRAVLVSERVIAGRVEDHQLVKRGRIYDRCSCGWYGSSHHEHVAQEALVHDVASRLTRPGDRS